MLTSGNASCDDGHTSLQVMVLPNLTTIRYCSMALGLHQVLLNSVQ